MKNKSIGNVVLRLVLSVVLAVGMVPSAAFASISQAGAQALSAENNGGGFTEFK